MGRGLRCRGVCGGSGGERGSGGLRCIGVLLPAAPLECGLGHAGGGGGSAEGERMGRKVRLEKTVAERPPCSLLRVVICSRHAHHSPGLQLNSAAPSAKVDGPPAAAPT